MSKRLSMAVWQSSVPRRVKPVLALLALFAPNDDGRNIFPSVTTLAIRLGTTRRTVQRHLTELIAMDIVRVVTSRTGGRGRTTEYAVRLDRLMPAVPQKGEASVTLFPAGKGDSRRQKRATLRATNGDTSVTRSVRRQVREVRTPPRTPPLRGGALSIRPFTRAERQWAATELHQWQVKHPPEVCPHDPPCVNAYACEGRLIEAKRLDEAAGRRLAHRDAAPARARERQQ